MRIVYFGSGAIGGPTLSAMIEHNRSPVLVVCQPDRPAGRGKKLQPPVTKQIAEQHGIDVYQPDNANDARAISHILQYSPDVGVLIAYGQILCRELLAGIGGGIFNLHTSLLPKYRGAAPINWAIINGESETGLTVMKIDAGVDTGGIVAQRTLAIGQQTTAGELHDQLAELGPELILDVLQHAQTKTVEAVAQDNAGSCPARKLRKEDGYLDPASPADQLRRWIHGLWPWPGARFVYVPSSGGKPLEVVPARVRVVDDDNGGIAAGTFDGQLRVATGEGLLEIIEIKPSGGRLMRFADFVNGRRVAPGDQLEQYGDIE